MSIIDRPDKKRIIYGYEDSTDENFESLRRTI